MIEQQIPEARSPGNQRAQLRSRAPRPILESESGRLRSSDGIKGEDSVGKAITIRAKGQITLPREVREAAHLEEGDPLQVEMTSEGILLRPQKVIDSTQAWFWTPAWQAGEAEASADIGARRVETYDDEEDFLASLVE